MPNKKSYSDSVDETLGDSARRLGHKYINEIEDGPLIHQLLINKLRANLTDTPNVNDLRSPFYRKPEVLITSEVKSVEPEIDELNKVLLVKAPFIEKESPERMELRKQNLNKEFLPVIAAMNTAVSREMKETLNHIRESFSNLAHHKEGIVTTVREVPFSAALIYKDFIEQMKIKYKKHSPRVVFESSISENFHHKIKV